jgi:hypothetical protein
MYTAVRFGFILKRKMQTRATVSQAEKAQAHLNDAAKQKKSTCLSTSAPALTRKPSI